MIEIRDRSDKGKEKAKQIFGLATAYHDRESVVLYIHIRWSSTISLNDKHRFEIDKCFRQRIQHTSLLDLHGPLSIRFGRRKTQNLNLKTIRDGSKKARNKKGNLTKREAKHLARVSPCRVNLWIIRVFMCIKWTKCFSMYTIGFCQREISVIRS